MLIRKLQTSGVLAATILLADARANVGYFAGSGQNIVLASTADVQMVSEDVTIVVRPEAAGYICRFELRNLSDEGVELQAGFPLSSDWYDGWGHRTQDGERESCDDAEAELVADRYRFIARDDDTTYHVRYVRHDAQQKFRHLFLWTMRFAPHETRQLHVSYDIRRSETLFPATRLEWEILTGQSQKQRDETALAKDWADPDIAWLKLGTLRWYSYVTETGASWAGEIERADFHVRAGLADEFLRGSLEKEMKYAAEHPLPGDPHPIDATDVHPFLTHVCLSPAGSFTPLDERNLRPIPNAYDWHFAPFTPGPMVAVGWFTAFLPASLEGVRATLRTPDSPLAPKPPPLDLLRAALAAWHGVAPSDDAVRSRMEELVWYCPVADRTEADLPDDVRAQLAIIDEQIAKAAAK